MLLIYGCLGATLMLVWRNSSTGGPGDRTRPDVEAFPVAPALSQGAPLIDATPTGATVNANANEPPQFDDGYRIVEWDTLAGFTFSDYSLSDLWAHPELNKLHNPVPEDVLALDGQPVVIAGYCLPDRDDGRRITLFRDLGSCCIGGAPQQNHYVDVVADAPLSANRWSLVRVYGRFGASVQYDEHGYVVSLYRMRADHVVVRQG